MAEPEPLVEGEDGELRCSWGTSTPDYVHYHDTEWGQPVDNERTLFEKMCLEGFQSGLSWITILRKRDAFRDVFANFDAPTVAAYGEEEVEALLQDARIIRHRGKIEATIKNARALLDLHESGSTLSDLIWSYEPSGRRAPEVWSDVPGFTPESTALSKDLKKRGFRFVGPTTAYAAMQAMGVVNDHFVGCNKRDVCEELRSRIVRPPSAT